MSFQFSQRHIDEYQTDGLTVFRAILPPSLIADLRRVTDHGRELIRAASGGQSQRFQPVTDFDIDLRPFHDYAELPALCDAVSKVLSPQHRHGFVDYMGVLVEPADEPYCTDWHRDARAVLDDEEWEYFSNRTDMGNQVNCALYEDSCTWLVPGSGSRANLDGEKQVGNAPHLEGKSSEERERICLEYCQSMPGAVRLNLDGGDFALYRPWAWHLGNYLPYRKRATLHEAVAVPEAQQEWINRLNEGRKVPAA